jgi:1-deoxy-D-xylulose-5-phosphate reductoisomerase
MMNKALEVIEAHYLFNVKPDQIEVVIHPQSVIHSMVEYDDGSVLAQLGPPDMTVPIAHALFFPSRMKTNVQNLDFTKINTLQFEPVDGARFPAVQGAYDCLKSGLGACLSFNAANEVGVEAYLLGRIGFCDIVDFALQGARLGADENPQSLEDVLFLDGEVRKQTNLRIV